MALIPVFLGLAGACAAAAARGVDPLAWRLGAVVALVAIGLSDVLDGFLARRHGLGTPLGALLDVLADKLTQLALIAFFALSRSPAFAPLPLWFLALMLARDVVLVTGSLLVRMRQGRVGVEHQAHGKLASGLMFALLLWITLGLEPRVVLPAVLVTTAVAVPSTIGYVREGVRQWRGAAR